MGNTVVRDDFEWVYTEQPHCSRRKQILGEFALSVQRKAEEGLGCSALLTENVGYGDCFVEL